MGSSSSSTKSTRNQDKINREIDNQLLREKRENLLSPKLLLLGKNFFMFLKYNYNKSNIFIYRHCGLWQKYDCKAISVKILKLLQNKNDTRLNSMFRKNKRKYKYLIFGKHLFLELYTTTASVSTKSNCSKPSSIRT